MLKISLTALSPFVSISCRCIKDLSCVWRWRERPLLRSLAAPDTPRVFCFMEGSRY